LHHARMNQKSLVLACSKAKDFQLYI